MADLVAEGIASTVPAKVRESVSLVSRIRTPEGVTVSKVAAELKLERSAAQRRLQQARDRGYLVNIEEVRGKAARYDLGEPMPEDVAVLPDPAQVCIGPCTHVGDGSAAGQDCECTGVCTCASAAEDSHGNKNENEPFLEAAGAPEPAISVADLPSADDAHLHTPGDDYAEWLEDPDISAMADLSEDEIDSVLAEPRADGDLSRAAVATKARAVTSAVALGCIAPGCPKTARPGTSTCWPHAREYEPPPAPAERSNA